MKKIEAIIRPDKLEGVKEALGQMGFMGITVTEVLGAGRQKGVIEGALQSVSINLLPKTKIEVIVPDDKVGAVKELIAEAARTGRIGDGKIFVFGIGDDVTRIRTGETGVAAV